MRFEGMYFGSHGLTHRWLSTLSQEEQSLEIAKSFDELHNLALIDLNCDPKFMCYPYGSYNQDTINLLVSQKVSFSLTTKVGAATGRLDDLSRHQLKRWDTNDFWSQKWQKPKIACIGSV